MNVFVLATANLPSPWEHPVMARRAVKYIEKLPGLVGVHPMYPQGTLLVFATLPHAEKAKKRMQTDGIPAANHIMRGTCERDNDGNLATLMVGEPVDGET